MNNKNSNEILFSNNSTEIIAKTFKRLQSENPKLSLASLVRKAKMASVGNLSDVMRGHRKLSRKYASPLATALGFNRIQVEYFVLLVAWERSRDENERAQIKSQMDSLHNVLVVQNIPLPASQSPVYLYIYLMASFALFGGKATTAQLRTCLDPSDRIRIREILNYLKQNDFIKLEGEFWQLQTNKVIFSRNDAHESTLSYESFIRDSLQVASKALLTQFPKSNQSIFSSTLISTTSEHFQRQIPQVRDAIGKMQMNLSKDPSDQLVAFNVQVFPMPARPTITEK